MEDLRSKIKSNKIYYAPIFIEVEKMVGAQAAKLFGILRATALSKQDNKCRMTQSKIEKKWNIAIKIQSRYMKRLIDIKLLKIKRNKVGYITSYQILEVNFNLLCFVPEQYKNACEDNSMDYFETIREMNKFQDEDTVFQILEEAITRDGIDINKIRENLRKLEVMPQFGTLNVSDKTRTKDPLKFKGVPTDPTNSMDTKDPLKFEGVSSKDKEKNYLNKLPSEVNALFSKAQGTRAKLNRRTVVKSKEQLQAETRNKLKGSFAKPKVEKPMSSKRKTIIKICNSKNFIQIKRHWNSLSGLKKISDLKEKTNKTLDTSILAVNALLTGNLFQRGITLEGGTKRKLILAEEVEPNEAICLYWLLDKITLFHRIVMDKGLKPTNKQFISKLTLGDFILGTERGQYEFPSALFDLCCGDLQTAWEDPHPKITKMICFRYNEYTKQTRDFSSNDLKMFSELGNKFEKFAQSADVKRSASFRYGMMREIVVRFFVAQDVEWRGRMLEKTPKYFVGEHAWSVFKKHLQY